jgi:hypothetical protein
MRSLFFKRSIGLLIFLSLCLCTTPSYSWYDQTHLAIAKAAGYKYWFNATGADITKIKAGDLERLNHFFDNYENVSVTEKLIVDQVKKYNDPTDKEGHLYGAIIASLRDYRQVKLAGKYAEYYLAFAAHYIGDLSQPLHNITYDGFNKTHHSDNDGIVKNEVLDKYTEIQKHMYGVTLRADHFEEDLAKEIARIANISRQLGLKLRAEDRNMTKEESYAQLGHSASLLRAVINEISKY